MAQPTRGEDGSKAQPNTGEDGSTAQPNTGEDGSTAQPTTNDPDTGDGSLRAVESTETASSEQIPSTAQPTTREDGSAAQPTTREDGSKAQPTTRKDGSKAQPTTREDGSKTQPTTREDGSAAQPNTITNDKGRLSKEDTKRKGPEADQHIEDEQKIVAKIAPEPVNYGLLNIRSFTAKKKYLLKNLINVLDVMFLTETWFTDQKLKPFIWSLPEGFTAIHVPRPEGRGGGVAIIYRRSYILIKEDLGIYSAFEYSALRLNQPNKTDLLLVIVYRPPPNKKNKFTVELFNSEFGKMMSTICLKDCRIMITGDFNFPDQPEPFMKHFNVEEFVQNVNFPTHKGGNVLDLIFTKGIEVKVTSNELIAGLSDHHVIRFTSDPNTTGLEDQFPRLKIDETMKEK